jgi:antitoxin component YwqK of YwqJK toxin-antitoxin module
MIATLLITFQLLFHMPIQDPGMVRQVMRKHPDGSPYVVLYFKASTQELAKEEVFYPNGKIQWTGTYKNGMEEGVWRFYHETGKLKSEQNYSKGKEHGTCTDYDSSGKMIKQSIYKNGTLMKEIKY